MPLFHQVESGESAFLHDPLALTLCCRLCTCVYTCIADWGPTAFWQKHQASKLFRSSLSGSIPLQGCAQDRDPWVSLRGWDLANAPQ